MELRFRAAGSSDIPQLVRLRLAYFEEESGMMDVQTYAQLTEQLHAYFEAHLGEDCLVNVAEAADGLLVSVVILTCVAQPPNLCAKRQKGHGVWRIYDAAIPQTGLCRYADAHAAGRCEGTALGCRVFICNGDGKADL